VCASVGYKMDIKIQVEGYKNSKINIDYCALYLLFTTNAKI